MAVTKKSTSSGQTLTVQVKNDILCFMSVPSQSVILNESDLQKFLVFHLAGTGHYHNVYVEYSIPLSTFRSNHLQYLSSTNSNLLRVDIVVERDSEFVPIELKFKTRELKTTASILRFGHIVNGFNFMNQGAQDIGRYDFWRDVKRLEILKRNFGSVVGGIALFVTNDTSYQKDPRPTSNTHNFSMEDCITSPRTKNWLNPSAKTAVGHPDLGNLPYSISQWQSTVINSVISPDFYYTYSII